MRKLAISMLFTALSCSFYGANVFADHDENAPRAVTLWWVIFNNPEECNANPGGDEQCGSVDVFGQPFLDSVASGSPDPTLIEPNLDAGPAVLYATGGTTSRRGRIRLAAAIYRSAAGDRMELSSGPSIIDPLGLGTGLENPNAEIHLVVRSHGRRVRKGELEQITGFLDPYCSDPNLLYFAGRNICADEQFAIFAPGESGTDSVYTFGTPPKEVRRASAHLIRNGDAIQAVVTTRLKRSR